MERCAEVSRTIPNERSWCRTWNEKNASRETVETPYVLRRVLHDAERYLTSTPRGSCTGIWRPKRSPRAQRRPFRRQSPSARCGVPQWTGLSLRCSWRPCLRTAPPAVQRRNGRVIPLRLLGLLRAFMAKKRAPSSPGKVVHEAEAAGTPERVKKARKKRRRKTGPSWSGEGPQAKRHRRQCRTAEQSATKTATKSVKKRTARQRESVGRRRQGRRETVHRQTPVEKSTGRTLVVVGPPQRPRPSRRSSARSTR